MYIVRDLSGGTAPIPIEVYYNGNVDEDSVTKRYKGSLVRVPDGNDVDDGLFFTWAGETTAMENVAGILAEDQGTSGNYLPNDATYGMALKKMYPLLPSSVVRAEYSQADAAGTANYDTAATGSAAGTSLTVTTFDDRLIGGWIYFINGLNAGYLHYVTDTTSATAITLATALNYAVVATDDFLVIEQAACNTLDFDGTYSNIKSEAGALGDYVSGIMHYGVARNLPFQRLDRDLHDGIKLDGAKFYHDFTIPTKNFWSAGVTTS